MIGKREEGMIETNLTEQAAGLGLGIAVALGGKGEKGQGRMCGRLKISKDG